MIYQKSCFEEREHQTELYKSHLNPDLKKQLNFITDFVPLREESNQRSFIVDDITKYKTKP